MVDFVLDRFPMVSDSEPSNSELSTTESLFLSTKALVDLR
jgi:hypothetical protein